MKKDIKVVFFGTSDRSVPILESLKRNFDLALCITKTDVKVGRNQELKETGVKTWAKKKHVDFIEIESLNGPDLKAIVRALKKLQPDYGVVADFSFIIPGEIIEILSANLINIHFSLLPKYRGASPVQHSILNGDETTGITFHIIEEKMDTGDILYQVGYKMVGIETSGELYDILFSIAADKVPEVLEKYSKGQITPARQEKEEATYTYSKSHPKSTFIFKEDALIDWGAGAKVIDQLVRAFNPWPIAWTTIQEIEKAKALSHLKMKVRKDVDRNLKVKIFKTAIVDDRLEIKELQVEGRNKFGWEDFKNGYLEASD